MGALALEIQVLSSVTSNEYIELISALIVSGDKRYQCYECLGQFKRRKDREEMLHKDRTQKGCFSKRNYDVASYNGEISYNVCPGNVSSHSAQNLLHVYGVYTQHGVLPFSGAYTDQPNKLIEAFNIIRNYYDEINDKNRIQDERKRRLVASRGNRG